jgi:hypothetical protein
LAAAADFLATTAPRPIGASKKANSDSDRVILYLVIAGCVVIGSLAIIGILMLERSGKAPPAIASRPKSRELETALPADSSPPQQLGDSTSDLTLSSDTASRTPASSTVVPKQPSEPTGPRDQRGPDVAKTSTQKPPKQKKELQQVFGPAVREWWNTTDSEETLAGAIFVENDKPMVTQYSWMTELLPYMNYQTLYSRINFSHSWTHKNNFEIATTLIPEFLDPGNPQDRWSGEPIGGVALSHFVGISGIEGREEIAAEFPRTDPRAGVFGYESIVGPTDITDGASNTVMIVGAGKLAGPWIAGGGATVRGAREPYFDKLTGFGTRGDQPGTNALFADGSTRFLSRDIDPRVFRALCTIHGGETVDLVGIEPKRTIFPTKRKP